MSDFREESRRRWDATVENWSLEETRAGLVRWATEGLPETVESALTTSSPSPIEGSCELGLAIAAHWRRLLDERTGP